MLFKIHQRVCAMVVGNWPCSFLKGPPGYSYYSCISTESSAFPALYMARKAKCALR
jgi:hypothetical protein